MLSNPKLRVVNEPKLTFMDYHTRSLLDLVEHPDFSQHAMRVATVITQMTTEQLEEIDITKFNKGEKRSG